MGNLTCYLKNLLLGVFYTNHYFFHDTFLFNPQNSTQICLWFSIVFSGKENILKNYIISGFLAPAKAWLHNLQVLVTQKTQSNFMKDYESICNLYFFVSSQLARAILHYSLELLVATHIFQQIYEFLQVTLEIKKTSQNGTLFLILFCKSLFRK